MAEVMRYHAQDLAEKDGGVQSHACFKWQHSGMICYTAIINNTDPDEYLGQDRGH